MTVAERIFQILEEKKISQKAFSEAVGANEKTVSAWRSRGTKPSIDLIVPIAKELNVSLEYLLTGEEQKSSLPELTENEQAIVKVFKELTDTQQGEIIGRAKVMAEQNGEVYLRKESVS